jgi:hypothetical protein
MPALHQLQPAQRDAKAFEKMTDRLHCPVHVRMPDNQ